MKKKKKRGGVNILSSNSRVSKSVTVVGRFISSRRWPWWSQRRLRRRPASWGRTGIARTGTVETGIGWPTGIGVRRRGCRKTRAVGTTRRSKGWRSGRRSGCCTGWRTGRRTVRCTIRRRTGTTSRTGRPSMTGTRRRRTGPRKRGRRRRIGPSMRSGTR